MLCALIAFWRLASYIILYLRSMKNFDAFKLLQRKLNKNKVHVNIETQTPEDQMNAVIVKMKAEL